MRQEVILGMSRRAVARISPQTWREITSEAKNIAEIEWKLNHRPRKSLLPSVRHCDAVALGNENLTENS